jgi:hypothetical protein
MLRRNIHEKFKERAQRALNESVEDARAGQQKLDTFLARLEFHSFDSEVGSYRGRPPAKDREAAPEGCPPTSNVGQQAVGTSFRARSMGGG